VAGEIAREMGIEDAEVKTVEVAAKLAGVGSVFVPTSVLTKTTALTPQEQQLIEGAYRVSAELLKDVTFHGPVVETIGQAGEQWDGSGPLGIEGEDILLPARIVAVAVAFVEVVSVNARRDARTFDQAAGLLLGDAGTRFDRRPVTALINILHNREGTERWAHFRDRPKTTE